MRFEVFEKSGLEDLHLGYDSDRDSDGEEKERRKQLERLEQVRRPFERPFEGMA